MHNNSKTLQRLIKNRQRFTKNSIDGYYTNKKEIVFFIRDTSCLPIEFSKKTTMEFSNAICHISPLFADKTAVIRIKRK